MLISLGLGALFTFGFPQKLGEGFFLLALISMGIFLARLHYVDQLYRKIFHVIAFNLGFTIIGFYWIPYTLQEFGGLPSFLSYLLGGFFALLPNTFLFLAAVFLHFKNRLPKFSSKNLEILFLAITLTTFEYLTPQQFPVYIGHSFGSIKPLLSLVPYGGVFLYSFFAFWFVATLYYSFTEKKKYFSGYVALIVFITINLVLKLPAPVASQNLQVRIVQANIGNFMKIESESGDSNSMNEVLGRYESLSLKTASAPIDLIIWPETAYPYPISSIEVEKNTQIVPKLIQDITLSTGAELVFGGYDFNPEASGESLFESEYNTSFHFNNTGEFKNLYHKKILIPFGETLPLGPFNEPLSKYLTSMSFFAKGNEFKIFSHKKNFNFITPICYEILQHDFIRHYLNAAKGQVHFIVNLTNDSWYGETAEPYQHLFLSHWVAIEMGIPLIRSTNTGITSVLYPDGSESERLMIGEENYLDHQLIIDAKQTPTLFQQFGFLITFLLMVGLIILNFVYLKILPGKDREV